MSNRSGKLLSTFFIASFAGSMLAIAAHSPAHADDTCLSGPQATTPPGSHWYYRVERGTKRHCWYLGEGRGKTTQRVAAKHSSPAPPTPGKPTQTSAAPPLQPAVANAHAEFDDVARNQANTNPSQSDTASSAMRDQASADPLPSDTAPAEATQTADASPAAVTTRWPDPAINMASAINVAQQPAPATTVTPSPQLRDDGPKPEAAAAPTPQLLGERSQPGPAVSVGGAPESEASSYSMPLLLGWLAGALAFAGLIGFAVVKFGDLSNFMHIRPRSESIWDVVDTGHLPPWQRQRSDIAPTPARDPLRARREIEAQSRDIMEILSRASRGATT
ncbi:hypothetical protein [Nitrobacter sp. JJSN]|uniref:hypothetical protein n=1 Tax=Nitrobacter sp. JJSN TaxID=3453033 RepID=UPI003F7705CD